jgi:hypothetical protein
MRVQPIRSQATPPPLVREAVGRLVDRRDSSAGENH